LRKEFYACAFSKKQRLRLYILLVGQVGKDFHQLFQGHSVFACPNSPVEVIVFCRRLCLVNVIDFSRFTPKEKSGAQSLILGIYTVFLKDDNQHCQIQYGSNQYDYQEGTQIFDPG
jgi:hypothetical protein